MTRHCKLLAALLFSLALVAAACGDDDDGSAVATGGLAEDETTPEAEPDSEEEAMDSAAETTTAAIDTASDSSSASDAAGDFPVTIESDGGTWTLESAPERIVSLSPSATEVLFAIGAGDQVVAVDEFSYYPPEAPVTDLSGFDPNVEAVIAFEPDLVVIANDANDLIASLTAVDIPVLVSPAPVDIESGYASMADLGIATGRVDETAELVASLRAEIDEAFARAPEVPIRIYHELDDQFYSASSFGFIGAIYAEMGAVNIADEADVDGFGFPQLTEEYIVEADPELIVITDGVGYTADDVAARPGWSAITAVANGNVVTVNTDISSRWGPRLPQFITAVVEALSVVAQPVG